MNKMVDKKLIALQRIQEKADGKQLIACRQPSHLSFIAFTLVTYARLILLLVRVLFILLQLEDQPVQLLAYIQYLVVYEAAIRMNSLNQLLSQALNFIIDHLAVSCCIGRSHDTQKLLQCIIHLSIWQERCRSCHNSSGTINFHSVRV